jgi:hypothetical protein
MTKIKSRILYAVLVIQNLVNHGEAIAETVAKSHGLIMLPLEVVTVEDRLPANTVLGNFTLCVSSL